jgi:hypothetical protein
LPVATLISATPPTADPTLDGPTISLTPRRRSPLGNETILLVILLLAAVAGGGIYYLYTHGFRIQLPPSPGSDESAGISSSSSDRAPSTETKVVPEVESTMYGARAVYSMRNSGFWIPARKVEKEEYKADLAMTTADGEALLLVMVVKHPMQSALSFVKQRQPAKLKVSLVDEDDNHPENEVAVGDMKGYIAKVRVVDDKDPDKPWKRFVLLAMVPREEHIIVVYFQCDEARRPDFEEKFNKTLASFRIKGVKK